MIRVREIKREAWQFPAKESDFQNHYYTSEFNNQPYVFCHVQIIPGHPIAMLHVYVTKFNKETYKQIKQDFNELIGILKEKGIKKIIGIKDLEDIKKWRKFVRHLGFNEPIDIMIEGQMYKMIMMEV